MFITNENEYFGFGQHSWYTIFIWKIRSARVMLTWVQKHLYLDNSQKVDAADAHILIQKRLEICERH